MLTSRRWWRAGGGLLAYAVAGMPRALRPFSRALSCGKKISPATVPSAPTATDTGSPHLCSRSPEHGVLLTLNQWLPIPSGSSGCLKRAAIKRAFDHASFRARESLRLGGPSAL